MAKIGFVSTLIPADRFKKKFTLGGITIFHLGEELDKESGAYKCFECSMATAAFNEDEIKTAFEAFKSELKASELATAKAQKIAEIDAYDTSSAVNGFVLNGATVWLDKATRVGLMNSTNITKAMGQPTTTLWLGESKMDVPCDTAIQLLSALEMYALECFNVTAAHKVAVSELTSIEEVEKYDITAGYPAQLRMEV
jgi:hypothetical protein